MSFLATTGISAALVGAGGAIVTAIVLAALRWGVLVLKSNLNEGQVKTAETLARIEAQTTKTNGSVIRLQHDVAVLQGTVYGTDAMKKIGGSP